MTDLHYALWVKRSAYFTLAMSLCIVSLKLYASIETNAAAMLASFTDAMLDVLVSGLNFLALCYALKPADDDHRFGHRQRPDRSGRAHRQLAIFLLAMTRYALGMQISGASS